MKWIHPKAVMLAKIQGIQVHCRSCIHEGRSHPSEKPSWCGKRLNDPHHAGHYNDPEQVCRHWEFGPDFLD